MIEQLLGSRLVAVERLAWQPVDDVARLHVGPVRLVFRDGRGLFLSGKTDWTLDIRVTDRGDDAWLNAYTYSHGEGYWLLRDAAQEDPFNEAMLAPLVDWRPVFNEMQELVGLALTFGEREIELTLLDGEVAT